MNTTSHTNIDDTKKQVTSLTSLQFTSLFGSEVAYLIV